MELPGYLKDLFVGAINSDKGVRSALRERIPVVDRLEDFAGFDDLSLFNFEITPVRFEIEYEARAKDGFYPHVRARLIEGGVVKKHNVLGVTPAEGLEHIDLHFHGYKIHIRLNVYNPHCKGLILP